MTRLRMIAVAGSLVALGAAGFVVPAPAPETGLPETTPAANRASASAPETGAPEPTPAANRAAAPAPALETGAPEPTPAASRASAPAPAPEPQPALATFTGSASYYADKFEGRTTASGVAFRQAKPWAAHRTLPFGTRLRVTNVANGEQVEVKVMDRGPFAHGRILDLSKSAARRLGFLRAGHTRVKVEVIERP